MPTSFQYLSFTPFFHFTFSFLSPSSFRFALSFFFLRLVFPFGLETAGDRYSRSHLISGICANTCPFCWRCLR